MRDITAQLAYLFTFAISSTDEFLVLAISVSVCMRVCVRALHTSHLLYPLD